MDTGNISVSIYLLKLTNKDTSKSIIQITLNMIVKFLFRIFL